MKSFFQKYNSSTLGGVFIHLLLAAAILITIASLYFFIYLPNSTNHGETITVPDIEGMHVSQLDGFLKDLRYEVSDSSYSADYPPLSVLKQYPRAGSYVKEGRKIFVSVNRKNPPTVPVPNLVDGSVTNADAVLRSNELRRGKITLVSGPFFNVVKEMQMQGAIIEAGVRVPKGSVIDLVVMDGGNARIEIENLVGQEFEDAKFYILGMYLDYNVTLVSDTIGKTPVVIKQKPEAGENIKVGDVVDLWIGAEGTTIDTQ
jgi:beta-lactam-binding protein with PASTA domain